MIKICYLMISCLCLMLSARPSVSDDANVRVKVLSESSVFLPTNKTAPGLATTGVNPPAPPFDFHIQNHVLATEGTGSAASRPVILSKNLRISRIALDANRSANLEKGTTRLLQVKAGTITLNVDGIPRVLGEGESAALSAAHDVNISSKNETSIVELTEIR